MSEKIEDRIGNIFLWSMLVLCILNNLLLAFGFRTWSWQFGLMAFTSIVLLPLNVYFLFKIYHEEPMILICN